jgi:drug/metabolite transporter (DMT)-like permease
MSWLAVALIAYLILAVVNLFDKFLVDRVLPSSKAYAFVACGLGLLLFALAPWFLVWPGWFLLIFNLINGAIFAVALWFLYEALRRGEAARALVLVGGLTPVFSLIFSLLFFKEQFSGGEWAGLIAILVGVSIIAFLPTPRNYLSRVLAKLRFRPDAKSGGLLVAAASALAYSLYFLGTKQAYIGQPFMSAFLWTRLGAALFVSLFLIKAADRAAIRSLWSPARPAQNKLLVLFSQGLGSLGFIMQNYAIFLGSVVLVNALQGTQYAFILILSALLAVFAPKLLKEIFSWNIMLRKAAAIAAIAAGLYLIAF